MWLMLQQSKPDDYVVATGELHSVREFVHSAFEVLGLDWKRNVKIDQEFLSPLDVPSVDGDRWKIHGKLG
jgi:GDPmannose 4,6-dehydratase